MALSTSDSDKESKKETTAITMETRRAQRVLRYQINMRNFKLQWTQCMAERAQCFGKLPMLINQPSAELNPSYHITKVK